MKTLDISDATQTLAEAARGVSDEPVVLTEDGKPMAVLLPIENADLETVSLSSNPRFLAMIERSRKRQREQGDLSSDEVRRRLGL
jgi:antitoxin (DNA-binding transcriptional repressor) of toxin-antitoxin stability system